MSDRQSTALTINVHESIVNGGKYIKTITPIVNAYRHSIQAVGGYWEESFSIRGNRLEQEEWLENGLNRHIEVSNPSGMKIWEGFVDKVTITAGELSITRGPLTDIINKAYVLYTGRDNSVAPAKRGPRNMTALSENTVSQTKWGVFYKVLSTSGTKQTEAIKLLTMSLAEKCQPKVSQELSTTNHEMNIIVESLGYVHMLDQYVYGTTSPAGDLRGSAKLQAILSLDPNNLLQKKNHLLNTGFEAAGAGGADVFASWTENAGTGSITQLAPGRSSLSAYCCRLTAGAGLDTYVYQDFAVVPERDYALSFWSRGDGSYGGRCRIYDNIGAGDIIALPGTGNEENVYYQQAIGFTTPAACTSVGIYLYCPGRSGDNVRFDDVDVYRFDGINSNIVTTKHQEDTDKTAWAVIKEIVTLGDDDNDRWVFGVYADRKPFYYQLPLAIEYQRRNGQYETNTGTKIRDCDILPGKWMFFPEYLVGKMIPISPTLSDLLTDPRIMMVEEARYSEEEGLTINRGDISRLKQKLAKLGLSGMSS